MQTLEKKSAISLSIGDKQENTVPELKSFARNQEFDLSEKMDEGDLTDMQKVEKGDSQQIVVSILEDVLDVAIIGNCSESWSDKIGKDEPQKRQKMADCQVTVESILEEVLSKIVMVNNPLPETTIKVMMQKIAPQRKEETSQVKQDVGHQQAKSRGYTSQQDREERPTSQEVGIWYLSCNFYPINCLD